jgi:uncharacterized membrane protein YphA (DoxX/SURF4 family)
LAIGWHFLYEGLSKWETYQDRAPAARWSAEGYLKNAAGPLALYFRDYLLDDPDGVQRLTPPNAEAGIPPALLQEWERYLERFRNHYQLSEDQAQKALGKLDDVKKAAKEWFGNNKEALAEYLEAVRKYRQREGQGMAPFEEERFQGERSKGLIAQRSYLLGKLQEWNTTFQSELESLLTYDQRAMGPAELSWREWTTLDWVNRATVYGLIGMGVCLMLGLFTRLAAFLAAVFLLSLYLASPPWPGLPGMTALNGHYLFVNFHIIETLAVLAAAGSGRWAGLDAIIHAIFSGKRTSQAGPAARATGPATNRGV